MHSRCNRFGLLVFWSLGLLVFHARAQTFPTVDKTALIEDATGKINTGFTAQAAQTFDFSLGTVTLPALSVTNGMLAGSIANAKLVNSSLTLGSTTLTLGATTTNLAGLTDLSFTGTTSAGLVVKSLTSTQEGALVSPSAGSVIYNTTSTRFRFYDGGAWHSHVRLDGDTMTGTLGVPGITGITSTGITSASATDLTLTGNGGASLVLGQGLNGGATLAPNGSGAFIVQRSSTDTGLGATTLQLRNPDTTANNYASMSFASSDGTVTRSAAAITGIFTGRTNNTNISGGLIFQVTNAATILNEAMRITPTANLLIGTTTDIPGSGGLKVSGTTAATSSTTGALQVAGGVGVGGSLYVGGGTLSSAGAFYQSGTYDSSSAANRNIFDVAGGFGRWFSQGPNNTTNAKFALVSQRSDGSNGITVFQTDTSGNATLAGNLTVSGTGPSSVGGSLTLGAVSDSTSTAYFDNTTIAGNPSLWFKQASPSSTNYALSGGVTSTQVNAASGGTINLRIANGTQAHVNASGLTVDATTASTSTTTGALVVSGGVGVAGAGFFGARVTATKADDVALVALSGNAANFGGLGIGRTSPELNFYVSSGAGIGTTGAVAGDGIMRTNNAAIFFDTTNGTTPAAKIAANSTTFAVLGTTDATTGGAGSLTTAGGIYAALGYIGGGGILSKSATSGIGYTTGAGGTVTQATSRTTGVTLNKISGAITLFTAAGTSTPASFTVTDSAVAATDTISLSVKSATNKYHAYVTAVAAGSFEITFEASSGTSSDAPVINFNVIKGSAN